MMSLDDLAGRWLRPQREEDFSLPTISNFRGAVQAAWDVCGIQNWMAPPTGMATATALLFEESGGRIRRFPRAGLEYRWKAYELERRGGGEADLRGCFCVVQDSLDVHAIRLVAKVNFQSTHGFQDRTHGVDLDA